MPVVGADALGTLNSAAPGGGGDRGAAAAAGGWTCCCCCCAGGGDAGAGACCSCCCCSACAGEPICTADGAGLGSSAKLISAIWSARDTSATADRAPPAGEAVLSTLAHSRLLGRRSGELAVSACAALALLLARDTPASEERRRAASGRGQEQAGRRAGHAAQGGCSADPCLFLYSGLRPPDMDPASSSHAILPAVTELHSQPAAARRHEGKGRAAVGGGGGGPPGATCPSGCPERRPATRRRSRIPWRPRRAPGAARATPAAELATPFRALRWL